MRRRVRRVFFAGVSCSVGVSPTGVGASVCSVGVSATGSVFLRRRGRRLYDGPGFLTTTGALLRGLSVPLKLHRLGRRDFGRGRRFRWLCWRASASPPRSLDSLVQA
ncbi:MAG: hypothetical protein N2554_03875 [Fimbriimonadales bacterium]|nr:hypothetical protein [Fimbriimonadales bacterium]